MPEPGNCMKNGQAIPDLKTGGAACRSREDCRLRAGTQKEGFRCMAPLMDAMRAAQLSGSAQAARRK